MSVMQIITCDRCHEPITEDRHSLQVESGSMRKIRPRLDLCTTCFTQWVDGWLNSTGGLPVTSTEAKKTR